MPDPGELRTVKTPCYRCKRLGVACIVRKTILGRPSPEGSSTAASDPPPTRTGDMGSRIIIELPSRMVAPNQSYTVQNEAYVANSFAIPRTGMYSTNDLRPGQGITKGWDGKTLLIHTPQSTETVIIIRALDALQREKVEGEWFRHLPARVGHTRALDLSIEALVAACAYARDVPKLTSGHCYQTLALALRAVQANMDQSHRELSDDLFASAALLAPFEGVLKKHGVPTCLHVEGLAAILMTRPPRYPVTELAREIFDFYACDSAIMACIQGAPSPFESVSQEYYVNNRIGCSDGDRAQLKALGSELFVRIPRLVGLVRALRSYPSPQNQLLRDAFSLSKSLLRLQDPQAEGRLLSNISCYPSDQDITSSLSQNLHFASVEEFEALAYYWQNRLTLLRLEQRLYELVASGNRQANNDTDDSRNSFLRGFGPKTNEVHRLVKNILMCETYARTLSLRKHGRLLSYAMVIVWGVMMDMPMTFAHSKDSEGAEPLTALLLRNANTALSAKPHLTSEDMDMAAEIFKDSRQLFQLWHARSEMAILSEPGIEVAVIVNGQRLEEYDDDEEPRPKTVTKYIEAQSGTEFAIATSFKPPFPTQCDIKTCLYIDGKIMESWRCKHHQLLGKTFLKDYIYSQQHRCQ
ncbi:hypothetical protein KJE20_08180 [Pyrenophora tritici-repentis]|uniref:DUF7918 domain-containing protein n=1 Tax=Pyrenophora tritici-repentis TaxID=45151 RepID=A0A922N8E7_9PLEO|nr:hypothetical protein Ptr86124_010562 [Pyrenophora tritici-repentis]KAI1681309.1 hypothetical protein KJE20_08180 [Pyrenophora tritici-repentis]